MIKMRATGTDGRPIMVFGLTPENLERLREGKDIAFSLNELGLEGSVLITFGETPDAIYESVVGEVLETGGEVHHGTPPPGSLKKN